MTSRAAAARWFDANLGATIDTMQVAPDGRILWAPRARTLGKRPGWAGWVLDDSNVRLDGGHEVLAVDDHAVILVWHDEDGSVIHTTTYTLVQQHCHDERHDTPCPLPCAACEDECDHQTWM